MIEKYYKLYSEIDSRLNNSMMSKLVHTIRILASFDKTVFKPDELKFINNFLHDLTNSPKFHANQSDLLFLKSKGIEIPHSLLLTTETVETNK